MMVGFYLTILSLGSSWMNLCTRMRSGQLTHRVTSEAGATPGPGPRSRYCAHGFFKDNAANSTLNDCYHSKQSIFTKKRCSQVICSLNLTVPTAGPGAGTGGRCSFPKTDSATKLWFAPTRSMMGTGIAHSLKVYIHKDVNQLGLGRYNHSALRSSTLFSSTSLRNSQKRRFCENPDLHWASASIWGDLGGQSQLILVVLG